VWEGVSPSPQGERPGEIPLKNVLDFRVKMAYFRGLLVLNFVFFHDENSVHVEIHQECKDCHRDSLACSKEHNSMGVYFSESLEQVSPQLKMRRHSVDGVEKGEGIFLPS